MARKRKAPASQPAQDQKPKAIREEEEESSDEVEEEEEEEESVEESSSEEEEEESDSDEKEDQDEEVESSSSEDDGSDEASKRETLRQMLEPFGKTQIIDLLKEAVAKNPKILPKIVQMADSDPTHRNIFVYGLGWDATQEQLEQIFKPFGEIESCKVVTDWNTGRAKGYAFVLYKSRAAAKKALKVPQKRIGNRTVTCQLAAMGPPAGTAAAEGESLKVYVGNVGPQVDPEKLKAFFRRFGEIEEGRIGLDPVTNRFKGFAVITYKTPEGYKKALEEPFKVFENWQIHCKKFVENPNKSSASGSSVVAAPTAGEASYGGLGVNAGYLGNNLSASGLLMAQNPGSGILATGYNPGLVAPGLSAAAVGASGNYGMSSFGPTVMGNYGSQAALNGLGPFQNAQTGQHSTGSVATTTTATRPPAPDGNVSAPMTFTSYFSR